jgi:Uma2 family endonuclease
MTPPLTLIPGEPAVELPDHLGLPDKDGTMTTNAQEHPQSNLITESLLPRLHELHPDGQFCICCDVGIYWRFTAPVFDGCKGPDWFYVPGVPPMLEGTFRRSYVLWKEAVKPFLVIEYVSGDGSEERDTTPYKGKFWVYEQGISAAYYAIFDGKRRTLEVHRLDAGRYQPVPANAAGRFPIAPLRVELGIWEGTYRNICLPWLRVWDVDTGEMIVIAEQRLEVAEVALDETRRLLDDEVERAARERKAAEEQAQRAARERKVAEARIERLAAQLRSLGIEPEADLPG